MKLLIIHNFYVIDGGENKRVHEDIELLERNDIEVKLFSSNNIQNKLKNIFYVLISPFNIFAYFKLSKLIKDFNPDVIHVHNTWYRMGFMVYLVLKKQSIPVFQTLHNLRFFCANALMYRNNSDCDLCLTSKFYSVKYNCYKNRIVSMVSSFNNYLILKSKVFISNNFWFFSPNPYVSSLLSKQLQIDKNKILNFPNYVEDFQSVKPDRSFKLENYLLIVSRSSSEKGVKEFLNIWKELNTHINLVIVGGSQETVNISSDKIKFFSNISVNKLAYLYQNCFAVVIPSTWKEGFPRVIIESSSVNKPVILSENIEISKLEEIKEFSFTFNIKKGNDFKQALENVEQKLKNGEIDSRNWYEKYYTEEKYMSYLLESFKKAVEINK